MTKDELLSRVQNLPFDGEYAMAIWSDEDVRSVARDVDAKLSNYDVRTIIATVHQKQDADVGINWEVITTHVLMYER